MTAESSARGLPASILTLGAAAAYLFLDDGVQTAQPLHAALAFGVAIILALLSEQYGRGTPRARRAARVGATLALAAGIASATVAAVYLVAPVFEALEARAVPVPWGAEVAAPLLGLLGHDVIAERGVLFGEGAAGGLEILVGLDKLGLRPLIVLALVSLAFVQRRPGPAGVARLVLVVGAVALARFVLAVCLLHGVSNLYSTADLTPLATTFGSRGLTLAALGVEALLIARLARSGGSAARPRPAAILMPMLAAIAASGAWGVWLLDVPGPARPGVVAFDDTHNDSWGRSDRRMDDEWFGDYSTYNLNACVEWLGHRYPTRVLRRGSLDSAALADVSVLVLKTPSRPYAPEEIAAIHEYVAEGGGLLAIGDHTDLNGMNTFLNQVVEPLGLRFENDAVSDGVGRSFNELSTGALRPRAAFAAALDTFQLMTPCTVTSQSVSPSTRLTFSRCTRDLGDYANGSNFGALRNDPALPYGPAAIAASARHGEGRVLAFGDSTVFSSFDTFKYGRDEFLLGAVEWLRRRDAPLWRLLRPWGAIAGLLAALLLALPGRMRPLLVWLGVLMPLTAFGVNSLHRALFVAPEPSQGYAEAWFQWKDTECAFPSSLGGIGSLEPHLAFDTLLTDVARFGVWPRIAWSFDEVPTDPGRARSIWLVNPVLEPPAEHVQRIRSYVEAGGTLAVVDTYRNLPGGSSAGHYLAGVGIDLVGGRAADGGLHIEVRGMEEVGTGDSELELFHASFGAGDVWFALDSKALSRAGLGHAFTLPSRGQLATIGLIGEILGAGARAPSRNTYEIVEDV